MKFLLIILSCLNAITLQEAFDNASPANGYDKYLELETGMIYTGGIGIYEGDVFIDCKETIINLEDGNGIWIYADEQYPCSLEIQNCSIINGQYYGLSFGGTSIGNIKNCNFLDTSFGLKLFDYSTVNVTNCIFGFNEVYGIGIYTENPILNVSANIKLTLILFNTGCERFPNSAKVSNEILSKMTPANNNPVNAKNCFKSFSPFLIFFNKSFNPNAANTTVLNWSNTKIITGTLNLLK